MKVVIFCGGLGTRLREAGENIPKPMVPIGYRPILWHLMRYYAHYGHKDFVLCLGYRADVIKKYFLEYEETISNDFVLSGGGRDVELVRSDIADWRITFADTGVNANIGQRLMAARKYVQEEPEFLANYADGLTDLPLPGVIDRFRAAGKVANFVSVRPSMSQHIVSVQESGLVEAIRPVKETDLRVNGGFFFFKREIFDYMREGEELVHEPFRRLITDRQLFAVPYDGWFGCMDTFKEKQYLEDLYSKGEAPWEIWLKRGQAPA